MRIPIRKFILFVVRCAPLVCAGYVARLWVEQRFQKSASIVDLYPVTTASETETSEPKGSSGLSRGSSASSGVITVHLDDLEPQAREIFDLDLDALERQLHTLGSYFGSGWVEFDTMDSQQIRQNLQDEETRLAGLRTDLREARDLDRDSQADELSVADQHPADAGSEQAQKEVDLSLLEQVESELSDVERAMRKLDDGTYGRCERCNEQIEQIRLEAFPAARYCIDHAS